MLCGKIAAIKRTKSTIFMEILCGRREQLVFKNQQLEAVLALSPEVDDLIEVEGVPEQHVSRWGTSLPSTMVSGICSIRKCAVHAFGAHIDTCAIERRAMAEARVRSYLLDAGYISVDVPVLTNGETSSAAHSFCTYSEGLGEDLFLRKSMDPFLRILSCAGMDRIFSIGKCFRNGFVTSKYRSEFELLSIFTNYQSQEAAIELIKALLLKLIDKPDLDFQCCDVADWSDKSTIADGKFYILRNFQNKKNSYAARGHEGTLDEFKVRLNGLTIAHGVREIETLEEYLQKLEEQGKKSNYGELELLDDALRSAAPPCYNVAISIPRVLNHMFACESEPFPHQRLKKIQ